LRDSFNSEVSGLNNISTQTAISSVPNVVQIPIDLKSDSNYSFDTVNIETKSKTYDYKHNDLEMPRLRENIRDAVNYSDEENYGASVSENIMNNQQKKERAVEAKFPSLNVIGQFNDTYILAQYAEDLYIIDQHAAHEKILFEKYMKAVKNRQIIAQILASPVIIDLNSEDFIIYNENKQIFVATGFNIENFGENTISIREVPIILGEINVRNLFLNIIDNIKAMGSGEATEVKYDKIAKLSCKSAIKARDKLSIIEMKSLVDELRFIDNPFTCPHGRPTIIKITLNELEKRFKRIQ
jgi:DNA mismatch repair protein MutL